MKDKQLQPPGERGRPPPKDIWSWVILLARTTGFRPSKRQPLPGNEVLWRACVDLWRAVDGLQALRAELGVALAASELSEVLEQ